MWCTEGLALRREIGRHQKLIRGVLGIPDESMLIYLLPANQSSCCSNSNVPTKRTIEATTAATTGTSA